MNGNSTHIAVAVNKPAPDLAAADPGLLLGGLPAAGAGPPLAGLSPGTGIIPASSTSSRAGSWLAARVAVNAP
jgi:hypothetical protein